MNNTKESRRKAGLSPASTLLAIAALLGATLAVAPAARAQDESGPPQRAVRLSYVDGKVSISQDNQVITDQAVVNTPLLEGMTLTTANDGRAEVQLEDGTVARISPESSLTLRVLNGQGAAAQTEMDLNKGLAYFELQENGQAGPISIRFGDSVVTGSGFTILRITDDTPPGDVAVFSGNAHLQRSMGLGLDLHAGQEAALSDTDPKGYNLAENIEQNSWDAWNADRDDALNAEAASQTAAPDAVTGNQENNPAWSDLDANGTWYNVPDQGYVWSPYDASNPDFDPYGNGNWVWTPGFGYTWVSAYSWGYLPYQCGAWNFYTGFGWGWAPGFGGCRPWWGVGYYSGPVIHYAPRWYHPVRRPREPHGHGWHPNRPMPVIGVHRHPEVFSAGLPRRDRNTPVAINGRTVMAVRTMPAHSTFTRAGFGNHSDRYVNRTPGSSGYRGAEGGTGATGVRTMPGRSRGSMPPRQSYGNQPGSYAGSHEGQSRSDDGQRRSHDRKPGSESAQPGLPGSQPAPRNEQPPWNSRPTAPHRIYTPPAQTAPEQPHNYTPPAQSAPEQPRNSAPPVQHTPEPPRSYSPPSRTAPEQPRSYTPPAQNAPEQPRNYTPPVQRAPEPPRSYSPPARTAPEQPRNSAPPVQRAPEPPRNYSPPAHSDAPPAPRNPSPPPAPRGGGGFSSGGGAHGGGSTGGGGGFHGGGGSNAGGGGHSGGGNAGGGHH